MNHEGFSAKTYVPEPDKSKRIVVRARRAGVQVRQHRERVALEAGLRKLGNVNIITRTSHCESFTMSGAGYRLNDRLAPATGAPAARRLRHRVLGQSETGAVPAQKLGQLQPFIALFQPEGMGQLAYFGPT